MVSKSVCKLIAVEKRLKRYSVLQQDSMMTFAWGSLVLGVSPVMPLGPWGEERRKKINARNEYISIFLLSIICSNCRKRHKATIEESAWVPDVENKAGSDSNSSPHLTSGKS